MRDFALTHVQHALYGHPWAILPEKLEEIVVAFERRRSGVVASEDEVVEARLQARKVSAAVIGGSVRDVAGMSVTQVGRVAILPMHGTMVQKPGIFTKYSGGTSAEQFAAAHEALVNDGGVKSIIWDCDTPGGSVCGLPEAHDRIMAVRGRKRTVALCNSLLCSAGYYLASAADEISSTPSGMTGSIGTVMAHADYSEANAKDGVKVTYIHAGKYKVEANSDEPLNDEARDYIQQVVDDYYGQFIQAVAKGRRISEQQVRGGYGEGRTFVAHRAQTIGLVDRVESLSDLLKRLGAYESERPAGGATARLRVAEAELGLSQTQGMTR